MLEASELGRRTSDEEFRENEAALRVGLLTVQFELKEADFPVIVVLAGDDDTGARDALNLLHEWMDPRYLEANVFERPTDEEKERPRFWRYWRALPPSGRIGIFMRAWTERAILDRALGEIDEVSFDRRLRNIESFEEMLSADGALVLKIWYHASPKELRRRRKSLKDRKEWRSTSRYVQHLLEHQEAIRELSERALRRTSRGDAVWHVVESSDANYPLLTTAQLLIQSLTKRLAVPPKPRRRPRPSESWPDPITVLDQVDRTRRLSKEEYEKRLQRGWKRLGKLSRKAHHVGTSAVFVFEGWDAAGKGGAIRRLTRAMDAAHYRVVPTGAPTEEERAHHYLWRFWRALPRAGHLTIFDRSWYGRVLVERLEGFAREDEWRRAYREINDFEAQLDNAGVLVVKFWIHIDQEEQLARFKKREKVPFKKYKITAEDYRNRERWREYEAAADEMVRRTSTDHAKWHLVAGNDKRWARIQVLESVCRAWKRRLKVKG
jgi:polyphosphate:AMP phosphotransferase